MKVRLTALYASPRGVFHPGTVIEVSEGEAKQLIDGRYAVALAAAPAAIVEAAPALVIETASVAAPETAAVRTSRPGARNRTTAKT